MQSNHAVYHLASSTRLVGVPHAAALGRVLAKLKQNQIPHFAWREPDHDFGFTAIATAPLTVSEKKVLSNYRLYNGEGDSGMVVSAKPPSPPRSCGCNSNLSGSKPEDDGSTPSRGSSTPVAQLAEQRPLKPIS